MMLQFLTLATLLWLVICTNVIYQKVTKQHRQTVRRVVGQQVGRGHLKRPIIRYYIFGYGVALIVLILTASINVNFYASQRHCFMKLAPFLGSVIVPAAVLLSLFIGFALSSYCVISTAPSHITEQIEIDAFVGGQNNFGGAMSVSTLERPDDERSSKSILRHLTLMFLFFVITWTTAALTVTTKSTFEQVFLLEDLFAIFFGLASSVLSFFILSTFCILRRDVRRCWQRPVCLSTSRQQQQHQYMSPDEFNNEQLLETANLMNPFSTNPTLAAKSSTSFKFPSTNFQSNASNHHLQGQTAFVFGHSGQISSQQYENCQLPTSTMHHHHVSRGTVVAQSVESTKDKDLNKIDSDDASSDHLSLNNMNHLRRGFVAPVNSGCVSEADYAILPPPSHLFAPKMLTLGPHASSPSGSHVPQLINLSPIAPTNNFTMISNPGSQKSGSVSTRPNEFPESQQENIYTESCTIKVGQLATKTYPDGPQLLKRPQRPNKPSVALGNGKSSSTARRHQKTKNNAAKIPPNELDDDDRLSNGSSTCSNNGSSSKRTHKRPKHRKPKKNGRRAKYDEPVEVASGSYTKAESSIPFSSEDKLSEPLLSNEDDGCNIERSSHLIRDLGAAELLKRETSV